MGYELLLGRHRRSHGSDLIINGLLGPKDSSRIVHFHIVQAAHFQKSSWRMKFPYLATNVSSNNVFVLPVVAKETSKRRFQDEKLECSWIYSA
jgi:hypothetical protein